MGWTVSLLSSPPGYHRDQARASLDPSGLPYDADAGQWNPLRPLGTFTFADCPCGNTLTLSSEGMPLSQLWRLLNWARIETKRRHMTPQELLNHLRDEITKQVLAGP